MGACEIYPQTIAHNPNGRFVVVCGDGEYIIYTAMALRNKAFGSAQEFVWAHDSSEYAIREGTTSVKVFKNFKEKKSFKPDFGAEGIFGGYLLGVRSVPGLAFYDWESLDLIRRIEIQPRAVYWSDGGALLCLATDDSYFILRYNPEVVAKAIETREGVSEDGIEDAFAVSELRVRILIYRRPKLVKLAAVSLNIGNFSEKPLARSLCHRAAISHHLRANLGAKLLEIYAVVGVRLPFGRLNNNNFCYFL